MSKQQRPTNFAPGAKQPPPHDMSISDSSDEDSHLTNAASSKRPNAGGQDDEFDFDQFSPSKAPQSNNNKQTSQPQVKQPSSSATHHLNVPSKIPSRVSDLPYDEAVDADSDVSVLSSDVSALTGTDAHGDEGGTAPHTEDDHSERGDDDLTDDGDDDDHNAQRKPPAAAKPSHRLSHMTEQSAISPRRASASHTGSETDAALSSATPKPYNPADYAHLKVAPDIANLFTYITAHTPQIITLETPLTPFIPDYIPTIGEVDAFIKPDKPDGTPETLGLTVIDEPTLNQSDVNVLEMKLRHTMLRMPNAPVVRTVVNPTKNPHKVENWIKSIKSLHNNQPALMSPTYTYKHTMPDINTLMQQWPSDVEASLTSSVKALRRIDEWDLSIEEMSKFVCAVTDIPIYDQRIIESLHCFFTLYYEMTQHAHFQQATASTTMSLSH